MRLFVLAIALFSLAAVAQTGKQKDPPATKTQPKPQKITFTDGDELFGDIASPSTVLIDVNIHRPTWGSMVRVRTSFADKLLDSVNDL